MKRKSLLFLLLMAMFAPLAMMGQETLTVHDGSGTNSYVPLYGFYADAYLKCEMVYPASELDDMADGEITALTFYASSPAAEAWTATWQVFLAEVSDATIDAYNGPGQVVYEGALDGTGSEMTIEFSSPFSYDGGNLLVGVYCTATGNYKSVTWAGETVNGASVQGYSYSGLDGVTATQRNFLPKTTFAYTPGEPPACPKPKDLSIEYNGNATAKVSWTSDATSFDIDVNGTVTPNVTNPYIMDVELATTYEVSVRANCGSDGYSEWTRTVSYTTGQCWAEDMCVLYFVTYDSYGDGWNGASITVTDVESGDVLASIAGINADGVSGSSSQPDGEYNYWSLNVCDGREIAFTWVSGNYDSECYFGVFDLNEDQIFESGAMTEPYYWTVSCVATDCRKPYDLEASEIGPRSVKLSWTEYGPATEWKICINGDEDNLVDADTNPFTLTGLDPETTYTVKVLPVCEVDKWSDEISFTTNVACPAPENMVASDVTATSALISWLGFGESYDLRYMVMPEGKGAANTNKAKAHRSFTFDPNSKHNQMPLMANPNAQPNVNTNANLKGNNLRDSWYYYDNGTSAAPGYGGIGTGSAMDVYWAVMFPAGMISESTLTKIAVYEEPDYNDNPITLFVYAGGNIPNEGNLLYTEEFTTSPNNDFEEFVLSSPVSINPLLNLWIVLMENGTYPACGSTNTGDPNGRWISLDGEEWNDVTDYGLEYTWMVRAYIEGTYEIEGDWIEVNGINASEYELTGLDPETTYIVQVRSNCGTEGTSNYSGTNFTTGSPCDLPYNLETADLGATSVTLDWTGSQPSYTLRYRRPVEVDPSTPATIILNYPEAIWSDGSGYQMLLDADATEYGNTIPTTGALTSDCSVADGLYDVFEYTIPLNADASCDAENIVAAGNSVSIEIPAGTYDWCITNPSSDDKIWISATNGNVGGRQDDYVFEPGATYEFVISAYGTNDGVDVTITQAMSDWIVVENITETSYELTGLDPETKYQWQVMGMDCDGEGTNTDWSDIAEFTTTEITTLTQTIALGVGSTFVSFNVETTLDDLKAALVEAYPNTTITIKSQTQNCQYKPNIHRWTGQLAALDFAMMYSINVPAAGEIQLEGMPVDPAAHPVTIEAGKTVWFAYPLTVDMTLTEAFAGFAVTGDQVKSQTQNSQYRGSRWVGQLTGLVPGAGYKYKAAAESGTRTLTF